SKDILFHNAWSRMHVAQGVPGGGGGGGGVMKNRNAATMNPIAAQPRRTTAPISSPSATKAAKAGPAARAVTNAPTIKPIAIPRTKERISILPPLRSMQVKLA